MFEVAEHPPRQRLDLGQAVYLIAEELHAHGALGGRRGEYVHDIPFHAKIGTLEIGVGTGVIDLYQPTYERVAGQLLPRAQGYGHPVIFQRRAQAVDAGHARHHYGVAALRETARRGVAQFIQLVVYREILLYIRIRGHDVRLGLVVVVIRHEIFHAIVGEQLAELIAKLAHERLVVREHQRRTVDPLDYLRHGIRLAAARHAQKHLMTQTVLYAVRYALYRLWLIARRLIR